MIKLEVKRYGTNIITDEYPSRRHRYHIRDDMEKRIPFFISVTVSNLVLGSELGSEKEMRRRRAPGSSATR